MSDIYCAYDLLSGKDVVLKIPDRMSLSAIRHNMKDSSVTLKSCEH